MTLKGDYKWQRGENSNCYRCLARNRSGSRRRVFEARVTRSRELAKHYQSNPFSTAANVALVDGDIGDPRTPQRLWILPYRDLGRIDVQSTMRCFLFRSPSRNTRRKTSTLMYPQRSQLSLRVTTRVKQMLAAEVRQHRQHLNDPGRPTDRRCRSGGSNYVEGALNRVTALSPSICEEGFE